MPVPTDDATTAVTTWAPATLAVTAGRPPAEPGAALNEPVWLTSTYVADGPVDYGRTDNRTWQAFESALGALEGGAALVLSSGMAAITAALSLVPAGARVVAPRHAYSGTSAMLEQAAGRGQLSVDHVDVATTDEVVAALPGAALLWLESPTNPMLEVADLPALCAAARRAGVLTVVDNTFATPLVQRPLDHGADVVVHSVTKYLAGHSDVLLGATVTRDDPAGRALGTRLRAHRHLGGSIAGPSEVWLALRGLRTLALRMERAQASAAELARRLQQHPSVARVRHPSLPDDPGHERATRQMRGYGAIVAIEVHGGARVAEAVAHRTRIWVHATSLGGVESSLERRRRHSAEAASVPESLLRLSVGIEDVEDLWADLDKALTQAE
ncbi:MAG TPA: aminotransferase class I/II-fold pyridoxal phosphate-dependent enzyme [Actinomycetales bacterium]|nr:aminotransferase class I/II-fold pyridoxal phosphate-dependent enzyme [Actinomycetales bacterium]